MLNIHDLKAAYEKAIGHATSDSTVYNLLHRHGWRKLARAGFRRTEKGRPAVQTERPLGEVSRFRAGP
jgi:hypothetical protein